MINLFLIFIISQIYILHIFNNMKELLILYYPIENNRTINLFQLHRSTVQSTEEYPGSRVERLS